MEKEKIEEIKNIVNWCMSLNKIPFLRGIACGWNADENTILVTYYTSPVITEEQKEELSCLGTEIISHFINEYIQESFIELPISTPLPATKEWGYLAPSEKC